MEKEKKNCQSTSFVNNQFQLFQLFNLDSRNLREIFIEYGEKIVKWENDNNSIIFFEENKLMD